MEESGEQWTVVVALIVTRPVPEFIYRLFSAWKQAEYDGFWKQLYSRRDKPGSETWVVLGSFSACFRPHQTKMLVLEEKMKTTFTDSFQLKRAYQRAKMCIHFYLFKQSLAISGCLVISVYVSVFFMHGNCTIAWVYRTYSINVNCGTIIVVFCDAGGRGGGGGSVYTDSWQGGAVDSISELLQVNKKHSKNALILYLIVVADSQLYWHCSVIEILFL